MHKRKPYLLVLGFGFLTMVFGQFMARPQFYGTGFGRAWAHVFWLGFLLFAASILTWFTKYITNNKNPLIVRAGKYQVIGTVCISVLVGLVTIIAIFMGNEALTGYDGDARRGVFVIWLLLILAFTGANLFILLVRQLKLAKRF